MSGGRRIRPSHRRWAIGFRCFGSAVLICVLSSSFSGRTAAQVKAGTLDPTFGGGTVLTAFDGKGAGAQALVVQPDEKLVVLGRVGGIGEAGGALALARYNPDGSLDSSFGVGGKVEAHFSGAETAVGLALQSDGRVVVAANTILDPKPVSDLSVVRSRIFLARFHPGGTLDPSFGWNGIVEVQITGVHDRANALIVQPDDTIVIGGVAAGSGSPHGLLLRFLPEGSLDPRFGQGGVAFTPIRAIRAVALGSDGRLIGAGDSNADFALQRYLSDGSLDPAFGQAGQVTTNIVDRPPSEDGAPAIPGSPQCLSCGSSDRLLALAIQSDGKIIAAGTSDGRVAFVRYEPDGTLDGTFGQHGKVIATRARGPDLVSVAVQSDGKILCGAFQAFGREWLLSRFNPDGSPDLLFGVLGSVERGLAPPMFGRAVAVGGDGNILVVGSSAVPGVSGFMLSRYLAQ